MTLFTGLSLLSAALLVAASVTVPNALDSQLPLIARVNQPFSWTFSANTFVSNSTILNYTVSTLPDWLDFDAEKRTFKGTPALSDESTPRITVTAYDHNSSASSHFVLSVTHYACPTLATPLEAQFHPANPALSSVFLLSSNSAIFTPFPALRVPPSWSFSIGFQSNTFESDGDLFYQVTMSDGTQLPPWLTFNSKMLTLNGFSPDDLPMPAVLSLSLRTSDEKGYTALALPFNLIVAAHELTSSATPLPTMNVTAQSPFNFTLSSASDFVGVFVDGKPIQSEEVVALSLDTSGYNSWLSYDSERMMLSGLPPQKEAGTKHRLPVKLTTTFNQTIETNVSLAIVPSYFSMSTLPSIVATESGKIHFNLVEYFSNTTTEDSRGTVNLTVAFEPKEAANYLVFDANSGQLNGTVRADNVSSTDITVTFIAYSHVTHSTAHTSLDIALPEIVNRSSRSSGKDHRHTNPKIALGVGIAFGIIGGVIVLCILLSAFRKCARVDDSAVGGEAAMNAWSDKDKKWYGLDVEEAAGAEASSTWPNEKAMARLGIDLTESPYVPKKPAPTRTQPVYGDIERQQRAPSSVMSHTSSNNTGMVIGYAVMRKGDFMHRIKETVRRVSDTVASHVPGNRKTSSNTKVSGSIIGIPTILQPGTPAAASSSFARTSVDFGTASIFTDSPSNTTDQRSVPRRRPDFTPLRTPATVHFVDTNSSLRRSSVDSDSDSVPEPEEDLFDDAVVHTATRAMSMRSGKTTSGVSYGPIPPSPMPPQNLRLVPFTSVTPVPTPKVSQQAGNVSSSSSHSLPTRVPSQTAKVFQRDAPRGPPGVSVSADDLDTGYHYVRTLGADPSSARQSQASTNSRVFPNSRTVSTNTRFSVPFSEVDPDEDVPVPSFFTRVGDNVTFRIPVAGKKEFEIRLMSGGNIPAFLHADKKPRYSSEQTDILFRGRPEQRDVGDWDIGVFVDGDVCVGRAMLKVM